MARQSFRRIAVLGASTIVLGAAALAFSHRAGASRGHIATLADTTFEPVSLAAPPVEVAPPPQASTASSASRGGRCPPEPLLAMHETALPPDADLVRIVRESPDKLGSASLGMPIRGALWGGVELHESDGIHREGDNPWGTERAVAAIERAVREVRRCHPDTSKLSIGDLSRRKGGWLRPHASHQMGLDADIGYYYSTGPAWYMAANTKNLDVARTWTLVRAFIEGGDVDAIFMDHGVQQILKSYAEKLREEQPALDDVFEGNRAKQSIIRHAWGHATHFHVRFRDPPAAELGQKLQQLFPLPGTLPYPP